MAAWNSATLIQPLASVLFPSPAAIGPARAESQDVCSWLKSANLRCVRPLSCWFQHKTAGKTTTLRRHARLLSPQFRQNSLQLRLVIGLLGRRRPVVQTVPARHAIAIRGAPRLARRPRHADDVPRAQATQPVHHPPQAVGAVAVLQLGAVALDQVAQAVARALEARLVAIQAGVVLAEVHADLREGSGVLVEVGAQRAQLRVEVVGVVLLLGGGVGVAGGQGRGEVVDVVRALEGVAEGLREV